MCSIWLTLNAAYRVGTLKLYYDTNDPKWVIFQDIKRITEYGAYYAYINTY